ncbi:MAG: C40 family peptidase [Bacteroidales bacterium]|nr:C40 family peptidase [Candidatus Sodaliphilus limicaballi]
MNKVSRILLVVVAACIAGSMWAATPREIVNSLKQRIAPDKRTAVWDVKTVSQKGVLTIVGTVGTVDLKEAVTAEFQKNGYNKFSNNLIVLENAVPEGKRWAIVKLGLASLRCEGAHSAEMATQAIMGTPVKVLEYDADDWCRVVTPDDYISYVPSSSISFKTDEEMAQWRKADRYIVTTYCTRLVTEPKGDETITDLTLGCILEYKGEKKGWVCLATPDGRVGYVEKESVESLNTWKQQSFNADLIERTARRMMGSGYLWGGTSTKVTDCSGLSKISYFSNGIILQRDASQQALTGEKFSDYHDAKLGDLLFFGNAKTGRVTHVGIYLRDGKYIHCSGQVKINSLDPKDPAYLYSTLSISRIDGKIGTKGITTVAQHKWYFDN